MKSEKSLSIYQHLAELRKRKQFHTTVEDKLTELLSYISKDYHAISEPVGLAGGRNDLMLFEFSGKKVLFEIFGSRSQVSRDLRILDKTDADIKIAIVIDKEIDKTVFDAFIKENPEDNYPFIFVSELFQEPPVECLLKLRQLILGDEEAIFTRMLNARVTRSSFFRTCKKEGIDVFLYEDVQSRSITYSQVFITVILDKFLKYGIARDRLLNLGRWMSDNKIVDFALNKISFGLNVCLYTDFVENFAVYSDTELADWIRAGYSLPQPYMIMSLNAVVHEIKKKFMKNTEGEPEELKPSIYLGMSQVYENAQGRLVVCSLPKSTYSILIIPPMEDSKTSKEYLDMIQFTPSGSPVVIRLGSNQKQDSTQTKNILPRAGFGNPAKSSARD